MEPLRGVRDYVRNPIGIIALFISLIYGVASILLGTTASQLTEAERWPIIVFIVIFPVLVLFTFYKLVTKHHVKLYSPSDYRQDSSFIKVASDEEVEEKIDREASESVGQIKQVPLTLQKKVIPQIKPEIATIIKETFDIENKVISKLERDHRTTAQRNVKIGNSHAIFDAVFQQGNTITAYEIKIVRSHSVLYSYLDSLLYQSILAQENIQRSFRLIIVVIHSLNNGLLQIEKRQWANRIKGSPVNVQLRFIDKRDIDKT